MRFIIAYVQCEINKIIKMKYYVTAGLAMGAGGGSCFSLHLAT